MNMYQKKSPLCICSAMKQMTAANCGEVYYQTPVTELQL